MIDLSKILPHDEVLSADGVHLGTVDHTVENAVKLTRKDSVDKRHHYVDVGLIEKIETGRVLLSAKADVAITFVEAEEQGLS